MVTANNYIYLSSFALFVYVYTVFKLNVKFVHVMVVYRYIFF